MKPSPIAPAANVFICSRLMPVDLRVVPGVRTPRRQVGEPKANGLKDRGILQCFCLVSYTLRPVVGNDVTMIRDGALD